LENSKYFAEALSAFTADVAYVGAVRHLYDAGYDIADIQKKISFPVSKGSIEKVVQDYEAEKQNKEDAYTFVQDIDRYGRKSFRKVKKSDIEENIEKNK